MTPTTLDIAASVFFGLAVVHSFLAKYIHGLGNRYKQGSIGENVFHLLGEVEVVFGFWAAVYVLFMSFHTGSEAALRFIEHANFTEPAFVFVIMAMSATRPVTFAATKAIGLISQCVPVNRSLSFYFVALVVGSLLGSFITEPAAMTVTALILRDKYFSQSVSDRFKYLTVGTLFVNISIGGTLTTFAAPPVLMVAGKWGWDASFMMTHFGYKAILAVTINAALTCLLLRKDLLRITLPQHRSEKVVPPLLVGVHFVFLALVVATAHHPVVFNWLFLYFVGLVTVTKEYQDELKLKESLLVGFFLAGLVLLGSEQKWWLQTVLASLSEGALFISAAVLTAVTDNAALTYLGSQVEAISDPLKYALVAGAVTGGGLTVIANAPNPAGYSILKDSFDSDGISPLGLLRSALVPTVVAATCFWFL